MQLTNPNQFERIRREEGYKNEFDIEDNSTDETVKAEIERSARRITELLDENQLNREAKLSLVEVRKFCLELSQSFQDAFLEIIEEYGRERRPIPPKIKEFLNQKNLHLPNFLIAHGKGAQDLLADYDFNYKISANNLLLVFQLPKPLAQFWWKGGRNPKAIDVDGTVIEWGKFYEMLMSEVWATYNRYQGKNGLLFYRINEVEQHDPEKYYYIWEVGQD